MIILTLVRILKAGIVVLAMTPLLFGDCPNFRLNENGTVPLRRRCAQKSRRRKAVRRRKPSRSRKRERQLLLAQRAGARRARQPVGRALLARSARRRNADPGRRGGTRLPKSRRGIRAQAVERPGGESPRSFGTRQWCLNHKLFDHAAAELADAAAVEPEHPMIGLLRRELDSALAPPPNGAADKNAREEAKLNEELDRLVRGLPPKAVEHFTQSVQPLLVNSCGPGLPRTEFADRFPLGTPDAGRNARPPERRGATSRPRCNWSIARTR